MKDDRRSPNPSPSSTCPAEPDRAEVATAGHRGDIKTARAGWRSTQPFIRATALGALHRCGSLTADELLAAMEDPSPVVRRRAAELTGIRLKARADQAPSSCVNLSQEANLSPLLRDERLTRGLLASLADTDIYVVDAAAWALGEREEGRHNGEVVAALSTVATGHEDALAREAAVAALGAIGDERGLTAILTATGDKPAVRRRAVLALSPFDGPEVEAAMKRAVNDRDWQVRQAAEDLMGVVPTASDADLREEEGTRPDW